MESCVCRLAGVAVVVVMVVACFLPGTSAHASFTVVKSGCEDNGQTYEQGQLWYHTGECARYGCFNHDNPSTYRMTCPQYPIPDCQYNLKSSPGSPFPLCCLRPTCVA